jgi:peptide/nickel transport system substrate-binding protein
VWGLAGEVAHEAVARYFTALLNQLGFKAETHLLDLDRYFTFLATSSEEVQMAGFWILSPNRSGGDMIVGAFTCPDFPLTFPYVGSPANFCSRPLDAQVREARALEAKDPLAANHLWAEIDRAIVDPAPAVMAFNPTDVTFVSQRVGNFEPHPLYRILVDQVWVQ